MRKKYRIFLIIFISVLSSISLFGKSLPADDDEYFDSQDDRFIKKGKMQLGIGASLSSFGSGKSSFSILGKFGYFFIDNIVAGPGMLAIIPEDNSVIYEPSLWTKFFPITKGDFYPYLGLSVGYLFSRQYSFEVENEMLDADISSNVQSFKGNLHILDLTPSIGMLIIGGKNMAFDVGLEYVYLYPLKQPKSGYKLLAKGYFLPILSISIFF